LTVTVFCSTSVSLDSRLTSSPVLLRSKKPTSWPSSEPKRSLRQQRTRRAQPRDHALRRQLEHQHAHEREHARRHKERGHQPDPPQQLVERRPARHGVDDAPGNPRHGEEADGRPDQRHQPAAQPRELRPRHTEHPPDPSLRLFLLVLWHGRLDILLLPHLDRPQRGILFSSSPGRSVHSLNPREARTLQKIFHVQIYFCSKKTSG
jgi:hypothetical protein